MKKFWAVGLASIMWFGGASKAEADEPVHAVVGTGLVSLDIGGDELLEFRVSVSAREDADGNDSGQMVVRADLDVFGLGEMTVVYDVDCLSVKGNTAWVGGHVVHSTNTDIFLIGEQGIARIQDLGGPGDDIMHSEYFPDDVTCDDHPRLPKTGAGHGDYQVR